MLQASAQRNGSVSVAPGFLLTIHKLSLPVLLRRRDASVLALRLRDASGQGPDGDHEKRKRECENAGDAAQGRRRQRLAWIPGHPCRRRARAFARPGRGPQ